MFHVEHIYKTLKHKRNKKRPLCSTSPSRLRRATSPYRGEALAWQKAQSLRQRLPSVGELSNEVRLRGCFYSGLFFCYLLFVSFRLFGLLLLTQLFDALFLALDARPWPREALVLFAPAGERIERESQPEQVQQDVQQA